MKFIRVGLAFAIGLMSVPVMIMLVIAAWPFGKSRHVIRTWARKTHRICDIDLFRMAMDIAVDLGDLHGKNVVISSTHPSILETLAYYCGIIEHVREDVIIIAKKAPWYDILYYLCVAIPLWVADMVIFVDRTSAEKTISAIRAGLARRNDHKVAVLVLTYNTRPTAAKIDTDKKRFVAKIPRVVDKLEYTTIPRVSAEYATLEALDHDAIVIKVTSGMSVVNEGIHHALRVHGATFHFHAEQESDTPRDFESLQRRRNDDCVADNDKFRLWRTPRP